MTHEPATANAYENLGPGQVIGQFLARLFSYLLRLESSGQLVVRPDIVHMVGSAEGLVQSFIRMRASAQLESAGFIEIAHAMRVPNCSREPAVHIERAQGCPPAELLARLKPAIEQFERADALAAMLARVILCALAILLPEEMSCPAYALPTNQPRRVGFSPSKITAAGQSPPYQWPPPFPPIPDLIWNPCLRTSSRLDDSPQAWTPACAGFSGR